MNEKLELTNDDIFVLNILQIDENPKSILRICAATGLSNRAVRKSIHRLRLKEYAICNDKDGQGYYLAKSVEDIDRTLRDLRARKNKIGQVDYRLKKARNAFLCEGGDLFTAAQKASERV